MSWAYLGKNVLTPAHWSAKCCWTYYALNSKNVNIMWTMCHAGRLTIKEKCGAHFWRLLHKKMCFQFLSGMWVAAGLARPTAAATKTTAAAAATFIDWIDLAAPPVIFYSFSLLSHRNLNYHSLPIPCVMKCTTPLQGWDCPEEVTSSFKSFPLPFTHHIQTQQNFKIHHL